MWFGAGLRHTERSFNVGGANFESNVAMLRLGAQRVPEFAKAPLASIERSELYACVDAGRASLVSTPDGTRGSGATNQASFGDDAAAGGLFVGWRHRGSDARFGIEAAAQMADVEWTHDAGRTVSVKRSDRYSRLAIAGLKLTGGSFVDMRGGLVNANLETSYCENGSTFTSDRRAPGARRGLGVEAPLTGALSTRMEYVLTAWHDHDASIGTDLNNFASFEGQARPDPAVRRRRR
jgi:hypothetical protein